MYWHGWYAERKCSVGVEVHTSVTVDMMSEEWKLFDNVEGNGRSIFFFGIDLNELTLNTNVAIKIIYLM